MFINFINNKKKEIFFLILLIIFFYRSPFIFLNGRFMAEEGSVYFANAYQFGFLYSFLFVDLTSGYLNLWANISGIVANLFSLKFAPLVSNYLALIPKIFIIILTLYNRSILLVKFEYKIYICFLIFLSPMNVPEIWLNSINSQIFFCIISFILVFSHYKENRVNYFHLILIFMAGLTGIYSCILFPVFFSKYIIFKDKQNLLNFLGIFVCTIVQSSLILYSKLSNILYEGKIHTINFDIFVNYTYNVFVKAFLGTSFTKHLYYNYLALELNLYLISVFIVFIFIVITFFLYNFLSKNVLSNVENKFIIFSSFYSFIATSFVVMTGAAGDYVGGRYAALPSFYLLMIVLVFYISLNRFKLRYFFFLILITSISIVAYEFRPPTKNVKHQYIKFLDCVDCPNWENEINNFQQDKSYQLKIWPYPRKTMSLVSY